MKIDRLLGIITILQQRKKVTAPELAEKFEVSRRTIMRDIEDICKAGIPILTFQGGDGGIAIAESFKLDKSLLTKEEMQSILAGLRSLDSVSDSPKIARLMDKLTTKNDDIISFRENIRIDLSSHYKNSFSEKIRMFTEAISKTKLVNFDYYSDKGLDNKTVEPYFITFKWTTWYLFGFCRDRNEFRLFKLNRLWKQSVLDEYFKIREIPECKTDFDAYFTDSNIIRVIFDSSVEFLLVEEYGPNSYVRLGNGKLDFTVGYTNKDYIIRWILGFGDKAKVIESSELAEEIKTISKNVYRNHEHDI